MMGHRALWQNPAGYGGPNAFAAYAGMEWRFGIPELRIGNIGLVLPGGWGVGLTHFGLEGLSESRIELGYGRSLGGGWRVGLTAIGHRLRMIGTGADLDVGGRLGLQYDASTSLCLGTTVDVGQRAELQRFPAIRMGGIYRAGPGVAILGEWRWNETGGRISGGLAYRPVNRVDILLGFVTRPNEVSLGVSYTLGDQLRVGGATAYHTELGSSPGFGLWYGALPAEPVGQNGVRADSPTK
jgi:hypothetical protein